MTRFFTSFFVLLALIFPATSFAQGTGSAEAILVDATNEQAEIETRILVAESNLAAAISNNDEDAARQIFAGALADVEELNALHESLSQASRGLSGQMLADYSFRIDDIYGSYRAYGDFIIARMEGDLENNFSRSGANENSGEITGGGTDDSVSGGGSRGLGDTSGASTGSSGATTTGPSGAGGSGAASVNAGTSTGSNSAQVTAASSSGNGSLINSAQAATANAAVLPSNTRNELKSKDGGLVPCGDQGESKCTACHFILLGYNLIEFFRNLMVIACILIIAIAGVMYIVSAGDTGLTTQAKNAMKYALWGIVVILVAWVVISFIMNNLALNGAPGEIYKTQGLWNFECPFVL